ncbi:MAG TPA: DUF1684 domain-containing protein [Gaiellaceae bacterium]|nr:DUF1684 domain-containing protein [Gaiellaceae bacterium]
MTTAETLALLDWKRRVFSLYAAVRALEPQAGWELWRETRDELFRSHPQSPLPAEGRASFDGLEYWPYDPQARVLAQLEDVEAPPEPVETSGSEPILFRPFARASFELGGEPLSLEVAWLAAYGGGVFLCFRDATSGRESYGGGRYLLDTVKGADLGEDDGRLVLDFNFAYDPSCSYDPGWACPLAPPANRLAVAVEAGERHVA